MDAMLFVIRLLLPSASALVWVQLTPRLKVGQVVWSKRLRAYFPQQALKKSFVQYEGVAICLPERLAEPSSDFLRYDREVIFQY